jgi:hypothetical protein
MLKSSNKDMDDNGYLKGCACTNCDYKKHCYVKFKCKKLCSKCAVCTYKPKKQKHSPTPF